MSDTHTAERIQKTIEATLNALNPEKVANIGYIGIGETTMKSLADAGVTEGPMEVGETQDVLLDVHGDARVFTMKYDPEEFDGFAPYDTNDAVIF